MITLIELAIQSLSEVDVSKIETVEINQTKYDDDSVGYSVNLTFPAEKDHGIPGSPDKNE